ncbi:hypothetical protein RI367_007493 [Sorochytrium milnesiophthora]
MASYCNSFKAAWVGWKAGNAAATDCCRIPGVICGSDNATIVAMHAHLPNIASVDAIAQVATLKRLVFKQSFGSSIPASIGTLKSLEYLDLAGGQWTGRIPDTFQQLQQLQYLDLSGNLLQSPFPDLSGLGSLRMLDISFNNFNEPVPSSIFGMANLTHLNAFSNSFSGSILPDVARLTSLSYIDLGENKLTGSLPPELFNLTKLRTLKLASNTLSGALTPDVGRLVNLDTMHHQCNLNTNRFACVEQDLPPGNPCLGGLDFLPICTGPSSTLPAPAASSPTPFDIAPTGLPAAAPSEASLTFLASLPLLCGASAAVAWFLARRRYQRPSTVVPTVLPISEKALPPRPSADRVTLEEVTLHSELAEGKDNAIVE